MTTKAQLTQTAAEKPAAKKRGRPAKSHNQKQWTPPAYAQHQPLDLRRLDEHAVLRVWEVAALIRCSHSTVWRLAKKGKLAAPLKTGDNMTGWRVVDVKNYLDSLKPSVPGEQIKKAISESVTSRAARKTAGADQNPVKKPAAKPAKATRTKAATTKKRSTRPAEVRA